MSSELPGHVRDRGGLGFRVGAPEALSEPPAPASSARGLDYGRTQRPLSGWGWLSARLGWLGFAGVILSVSLLALSAARTDLLLPESVRPVPSSLQGAFGGGGIDLGLGGLAVVLALMFVAYAAMVRGADQLTARPVLIAIGCLTLIVLLAPLMLSTDVFSYIAYGRIGGVYGFNPYLAGPGAILRDPLYPYIGTQWVNTASTYGPLFTAISYLFAHLSIPTQVNAYKMIAGASSLLLVWVVWSSARIRGLNPVKAVAIVGLNPVVVIFGVGGGHNDLLMVAIAMCGVYALLQHRPRASGALLVAATAVKLTAGLMLPFAFAHVARGMGGARPRRALLAGAATAAAVAVGLSFALFGVGWLHLFATLVQVQAQGGIHSVPGLFLTPIGIDAFAAVVHGALDLVFVGFLVWLTREIWFGRIDWITAAGWATVAMLCTAGLLLPWYVAWLVPLAALSRDRALLVATVLLTGLGLTTL
ncbi:MAG TPA: glycosyltransferase 87 family protein [Solirubrobacteraceae bacterium]